MEKWQTSMLGIDIEDFMKNPFEAFAKLSNNSHEIIKNNMKYQKACIAYHQAIHDMLEATNDNVRILKN
jgi:hypothetical protein